MNDGLANVASLDVLRNVRAGDVVWVTLKSAVEDEEVAAVQHILGSVLQEDVHLIVTRSGYLENIRKVPVAELIHLRTVIDQAVDTYAVLNPHVSGV